MEPGNAIQGGVGDASTGGDHAPIVARVGRRPLPGVVQKIYRAYRQLDADRGEFLFFAAFRRRNAALRNWDVVVCARGMDNTLPSIERVYNALATVFTPQDLPSVAQIVVIEPENPIIRSFVARLSAQSPPLRMRDFTFAGQYVKVGYVFAASLAPDAKAQRVRKVRVANVST